mmetsp:Transcript_22488/g.41858  ORF Transcript_22488/g.41858 Transcript_22488/m.41858 type:complete len:218 (-) Transcript_22488:92-745(-)
MKVTTFSPLVSAVWFSVVYFFAGTAAAESCPGAAFSTTSCSEGIFTGSSLSTDCSSDENSVTVTGSVTAKSEFDGNSQVTLLPCLRYTAGAACLNQYAQEVGSICNYITSTSGDECGSAGEYTITQTFEIPEEAQKYKSLFSMATVKVLVGDDEDCEQSRSAYLTVGVASLFAVSGVSLYFMRRRKRPLLVLDDEEDGQGTAQHRFIEMKDTMGAMA